MAYTLVDPCFLSDSYLGFFPVRVSADIVSAQKGEYLAVLLKSVQCDIGGKILLAFV
jgi:hypothetical protein